MARCNDALQDRQRFIDKACTDPQRGQTSSNRVQRWPIFPLCGFAAWRFRTPPSNEAARRLYNALGFVEYGFEKRTLKQDGRYYDDVLMVKFFDGD
jgi:ribosomal protein S18 acetylase RimI-like enzyme